MSGDAQSLSGCLDHVTVRTAVDPQDNRQARHALRTNQTDLDPALGGVGEDRHDALFGKVDALDGFPRLDHPLAQVEGNGLKMRLEQTEVFRGEPRKKTVADGRLL